MNSDGPADTNCGGSGFLFATLADVEVEPENLILNRKVEIDNMSRKEMDAGLSGIGEDFSHYFNFGSSKAGMDSDETEKSRQSEIVYEMSKNSHYFQRAAHLDEKNKHKIEVMARGMASITEAQRQICRSQYEKYALELEARRDLERICCVIDMDMFFAAVEIRDAPHLKDLPV